jgi:hypothetical protein
MRSFLMLLPGVAAKEARYYVGIDAGASPRVSLASTGFLWPFYLAASGIGVTVVSLVAALAFALQGRDASPSLGGALGGAVVVLPSTWYTIRHMRVAFVAHGNLVLGRAFTWSPVSASSYDQVPQTRIATSTRRRLMSISIGGEHWNVTPPLEIEAPPND